MAMLNNQREQKERKEGRCSGGGSSEPRANLAQRLFGDRWHFLAQRVFHHKTTQQRKQLPVDGAQVGIGRISMLGYSGSLMKTDR